MSSPYVRTAIREGWQQIMPTVPFVETINTRVDPARMDQTIWGTLIFDSLLRGDQTMGSQPWIEEQGTATIVLMSQAGVTDDDLAAVAGNIVKLWTMWIDSTGDLWIHSVDAPRPPDPEAVGDVFRLTVTLNYRYQTRGGK